MRETSAHIEICLPTSELKLCANLRFQLFMYFVLTAKEKILLCNKAGLMENLICFVVEGSVAQSERDSLRAKFLKVHAGFYCRVQKRQTLGVSDLTL